MNDVVHVITTICMGGAEKQLLTLIAEQVKSGRRVTVVYLKGLPELENAIRETGSYLVKSLSNSNPIFQIFYLRKLISKNKNFIVHAHLPRAELLTYFLKRGSRIVLTRHNAEQFYPSAPKLISKYLSRLVANRAHKIIAISEAVKNFLIESNEVADISKIHVVYYGFASPSSRPNLVDQRIKNLKTAKFLIGTIARLVPQKDLETLLKAFAIFSRENSDAMLVIVGDGYLKENLIEYSVELGISEKITWFGRTEDIPSIIRTMDVFALTSLYEGFGLVLLEAMSEGVPIAASRNSAIPEVLGDDYEGLFDTRNEVMLAALFSLMIQPQISSRMKFYLKERMKMFEPNRMRIEVDTIYAELETR